MVTVISLWNVIRLETEFNVNDGAPFTAVERKGRERKRERERERERLKVIRRERVEEGEREVTPKQDEEGEGGRE